MAYMEGIMKEQDNIGLVRQAYEAFDKGDTQRLLSLFARDIDWDLPEVEGISFTGKRKGVDQVAEFFRQMADQQDAREFKADDFIGQGDRVVVLGHCTWTVKATGLDYSDEFCHLFTIKDGKIASFKEFADTHRAALAYQPRPGTLGAGAAAAATTRSSVH
jgi:ketosteroid isomerase-like protein